ncbi:uncharacterized protein LOC111269011 [Varroa jacobsoni]|uniref:uncharacterized protein LOC111269011 n=1 Tax=Varroa jacobsoni TaxID=62625 RepID=UPI000BF5851F|nr:uncharacterized protein LOC111269011 [Varroa jacobsoni]
MVCLIMLFGVMLILGGFQSSKGYDQVQSKHVTVRILDDAGNGADVGVDVVTMDTLAPPKTKIQDRHEENYDDLAGEDKSDFEQLQGSGLAEGNRDAASIHIMTTESLSNIQANQKPEQNSIIAVPEAGDNAFPEKAGDLRAKATASNSEKDLAVETKTENSITGSSIATPSVENTSTDWKDKQTVTVFNTPALSDSTAVDVTTHKTRRITTANKDAYSAVEAYTRNPVVGNLYGKDQRTSKNNASTRIWFETAVRLDVDQRVNRSLYCCGGTSLRSTVETIMTFPALIREVSSTGKIKKQKCWGCGKFKINSITCRVPRRSYETKPPRAEEITFFESLDWQCHSPRGDLDTNYKHNLNITCTVIKLNGDLNVCVHQDRCQLKVVPHDNARRILSALLRSRRTPFDPTMATILLFLAVVFIAISLVVIFLVVRNWME